VTSVAPGRAAVDLDALADLEEQRRFLLESLRDLDHELEAGDIDENDYRTLRDDYTVRAAAVVRAIEQGHARLAAVRRAKRRSPRFVAVAVAGVVGVALLAGVLVAAVSGQRLPGQTVSGSVAASTSDRLAQAQQKFTQGDAVGALKLYDRVLEDDPRNAQALTFRGWILELAGLHDQAIASLDKALAADSTFAMTHFFKAMVLFQGKNEPAAAIPEFQAFLATNPPPDAVNTAQTYLQQAQAAAAAAAK
jgi:tetratricopeptide (TPR) repeat protein